MTDATPRGPSLAEEARHAAGFDDRPPEATAVSRTRPPVTPPSLGREIVLGVRRGVGGLVLGSLREINETVITAVLIIGSIPLGVVALVAVGFVLFAVRAVVGPVVGDSADAALGIAWFGGGLVAVGIAITWFVRTVGRRLRRGLDRSADDLSEVIVGRNGPDSA